MGTQKKKKILKKNRTIAAVIKDIKGNLRVVLQAKRKFDKATTNFNTAQASHRNAYSNYNLARLEFLNHEDYSLHKEKFTKLNKEFNKKVYGKDTEELT